MQLGRHERGAAREGGVLRLALHKANWLCHYYTSRAAESPQNHERQMRPEIHKSSINGERDGKERERERENNLKKKKKKQGSEGAEHRRLKAKAKAKAASSTAPHLTS